MPGMGGTPIRKRAGQRRHRVTLQAGTTTEDTIGGEAGDNSTTPTTFGYDSAAIDEVPFIVSETEASILYKVTLRYRADVVTRFNAQQAIRVVAPGKTMKVLQIENPEQRNIELVLHCGKA